jgi:hypothetical protein
MNKSGHEQKDREINGWIIRLTDGKLHVWMDS